MVKFGADPHQDSEEAKKNGLPTFVVTPNGAVQKIDPKTGKVSVISTDVPSDPKSPTRKNSINPSLKPYVPTRPKVTLINVKKVDVKPQKFDTPNIDELRN